MIMYLQLSSAFGNRVKLLVGGCSVLFLLSGDCNLKKKLLWDEFEWAFMRELPIHMADFDKVHEFDVAFQQVSTYNPEIYYPDKYMVGIYLPAGSQYERIHLLSRVNPFLEYTLLKSVSDMYQTDTTHLDVLARTHKNQLEAIVYRKVKSGTKGEQNLEFAMWKKEKILLYRNGFKTKLIEKWNSHLFN